MSIETCVRIQCVCLCRCAVEGKQYLNKIGEIQVEERILCVDTNTSEACSCILLHCIISYTRWEFSLISLSLLSCPSLLPSVFLYKQSRATQASLFVYIALSLSLQGSSCSLPKVSLVYGCELYCFTHLKTYTYRYILTSITFH